MLRITAEIFREGNFIGENENVYITGLFLFREGGPSIKSKHASALSHVLGFGRL